MVWNSSPDDLRAQQDYESCRQGQKTWLFSRYYSVFSALETSVIIALYKSTFTIPYILVLDFHSSVTCLRNHSGTSGDS